MFKKGDKVICVDYTDTDFSNGEERTIEHVFDAWGEDFVVIEGDNVDLPLDQRGWWASRFKLVSE